MSIHRNIFRKEYNGEVKRFIVFSLVIVIVLFGVLQIAKKKIGNDLRQPVGESIVSPSPTLTIEKNGEKEKLLFVPYWTLTDDEPIDTEYDTYLYFGITPDKNGIVAEEGLQAMERFTESVPDGKRRLLVLRMIDSTINAEVLGDTALQQKIISQTIEQAEENNFQGVVLDLEMNAIPFTSLIEQINTFNKLFFDEVKKSIMEYSLTMYGDVFYRIRPFDMKNLSQNADTVLIMAYDFHKSRGNPGPNFPLAGKAVYGYSMKDLMNDLLRVVPSSKVVIIFGMFGYDWEVDNAGKGVSQGKPVTLKQVTNKFLQGCPYKNCSITRDEQSSETNILYTDDAGQKHSVWFEDTLSSVQKQQYLQTMSIGKYAYWAYTYY